MKPPLKNVSGLSPWADLRGRLALFFNQAHDSLVQLTRTFWGQAGLCAVCGILTALAHPPFGVIGGIMAYGLWLWGLGRDFSISS